METAVRVQDDPTPEVVGRSYLRVYTYRLGRPAFGLVAGTLVEHGSWVCDCRGGIDPNCGGPGCWGITAEAAARFAAAEVAAWRGRGTRELSTP